MHMVSTLPPDALPGRPLGGTLSADAFEAKFKEICCGRPKPLPPKEPPIWLLREDLSVVAVPYDNPRVQDLRSSLTRTWASCTCARSPGPSGPPPTAAPTGSGARPRKTPS